MAQIKIKRTSGSTTPTGLTFGELAYVQGIKSIYIGQTGGDPALRIGAEVDSSTSLGTSDNKIPTQNAVKTYIDNNIAGGAVTSVDGVTGAVDISAGTGIGIGVSGKVITITNTGVQSIAGTSNQITASGSTGAVTLSLPSALTVPGSLSVTTDLTVTGNLTVNGSTTTVNTDTITVDDPIITLGLSGGVPISVSDGGKSRGIALSYFDGSAGQTAFFGVADQSNANLFTYYSKANIIGETISAGSTFGILQANGIYLQKDANSSAVGRHIISSQSTTISGGGRQTVFADHGGYVVMPQTLGTLGYILKANGVTAQPTWIDANAAGFTAYAAGRLETARTIGLTGDVSGSASFNGSADINITATIAANSVALGTDTTGDYVSSVAVSGIGLSVAGSGENATYTVTSGATSNNVVSQIVARDASGNFSAGTITASLTGNASTASTLQTSRTIGLTGDVSGSASFNGSADINITATIAANSVALGTDTTGNYLATLTTSSTGLTVANSGTESAAVTVNFATITTGLDMGTFSFASGEFTNSSGTVSLGVVDGGSY